MMFSEAMMKKACKFTFGVFASLAPIASLRAQTPAPYLLPYTINTLLGGGTAPKVASSPTSCPTGVGSTTVGFIYDTLGDGCLATSPSVVTGTDVHDVGVDSEGNVYFIDNGSTGLIRKIDARSGIVNVLAGAVTGSTVCTGTIDKYGDNCPANNGMANAAGSFTAAFTKGRGIGVSKNGDVYFADYNGNLDHKISAATGVMTIVAGFLSGTAGKGNSAGAGYTGDGGIATSAAVNASRGITADAAGNIYIADSSNHVIRKVNTSGIISTIVGAFANPAVSGFAGDGGPATSAKLNTPEDVEVDANGNLFIGDFGNNRVRVVYQGGAQVAALIAATGGGVAQAGSIYTIAGNGGTTFAAVDTVVNATGVAISQPRKIALDARGNIYIADNGNSVVWFLDGTTGFIRQIAGTQTVTSNAPGCGLSGTIGDGCPATLATLNPNSAMGVAVDSQENLYITDPLDSRLRKVSVNRNFPAIASGSSVTQTLMVHFAVGDTPVSSSAFTVANNTDFTITGSPTCSTNSDNTTDCTMNVTFSPTEPGLDTATLVVKSSLGTTARFGLTGTGTIAAVALDPGFVSALGTTFKSPAAITIDAAGNTYVADTGNNIVMRYDRTGTGAVIAGTGAAGNSGNGGPATSATLAAPSAVAVTSDGAVYIADTGNNVVRRIDPFSGNIGVVAGGSTTTCAGALDSLGDGCPGTQSSLSAPAGLASDSRGDVYIADTGNNLIRELPPNGYIFGIGGPVFSGPTALQVDPAFNIFVADTGHSTVSEIVASTGKVVSVAGNGQSGSSGNGGAAIGAELSGPTGIALDAAGDLYIADTGNHVIRQVNSAGIINTVVGTLGQSGDGTVPGSATPLLLSSPHGVASSTSGALYVLDSGNNRAFSVDRSSVIMDLGRSNPNSSSPVQTIQETSTGTVPANLPSSALFVGTGDSSVFSLTPQTALGCTPGAGLTPGTTCFIGAQFNPTALGTFSATFTQTGITPAIPATPMVALSGIGTILTSTASSTVITSPTTGNPQYSVAFTVSTTVTPSACNTKAPSCIPTGTVQFFVGTTAVGIPVALGSTGVASTSINGQNVGTITVTAVYSGDDFYGNSTAPPLSVTVTTGNTTSVAVPSSLSIPQFQPLSISAKVMSATGGIPTGTASFFSDGMLLGTAPLNSAGIAIINDPQLTDVNGKPISPAPSPNSFRLTAGTHAITVAYSGDANYSKSTSPVTTLMIQPDTATFTAYFVSPTNLSPVSSLSAGTAQGSTALATVTVVPTNTLSGTVTFTCSGLPANSVCTVSPTSLLFSPVPGVPASQSVGVTLWTDVAPGTIPAPTSQLSHPEARHLDLAIILGWPLLLTSFAGLVGCSKRTYGVRLFSLVALVCLLAGASLVISGCSGGGAGKSGANLTPTGKYNVTLTINGPNNTVQTLPIQFNVATGVAGQE
jgi:sugar lactone lactonase YvrE